MATFHKHKTLALLLQVDDTHVFSWETLADEYGSKTIRRILSHAEADAAHPGWRDDFELIDETVYQAKVNEILADVEG